MSCVLGLNQKITMKNTQGKIVEVENKQEINYISTLGKFGIIPSYRKFPSSDIALDKANRFITKKVAKGYKIEKEEQKGEYLEKGDAYWKCLVVGCEIKVQSGSRGKIPETSIYKFKTLGEAAEKAKFHMRLQIAKGFIRNPSKFTDDFDDLKGTVVLDPLESLSQHCKMEVSEDEDEDEDKEEHTDELKPIMLKRSCMVDVNEIDFPKETAMRLSAINLLQVVEEEQENGLVKSFIFEKPEVSSLQSSVITDVLEEVDVPKKRSREGKSATIQSMLSTLGMSRYTNNFESRGITVSGFLELEDGHLKDMNIPKRARDKILDCKAKGKWDIQDKGNSMVIDEREEKVKTKNERGCVTRSRGNRK